MQAVILIGTGSFLGGISRYLLSLLIHERMGDGFPLGTLTVNILGCFLIGVTFGFAERFNLSPEWRLFIATGILGGFTTFSAFSNETVAMMRDGQLLWAGWYAIGSVIFGLVATYIGIVFERVF